MRFVSPVILLVLSSLVMSSCSFHTAERMADYGREYDCVVLRKDSPSWVGYRTRPAAVVCQNGKNLPEFRAKTVYFQGERSMYTRRGARMIRPVMHEREHGASFTHVSDAPVTKAYIHGDGLWLGSGGRQVALWRSPLESLPEGVEALPALAREKLEHAGLDEAVLSTRDTSLTPHAIWAYPLAGVCAIAIDVPLSLICTLPVAISLPLCELCISVRDGVCDVAAQVAPQQQEPVVVEGK